MLSVGQNRKVAYCGLLMLKHLVPSSLRPPGPVPAEAAASEEL